MSKEKFEKVKSFKRVAKATLPTVLKVAEGVVIPAPIQFRVLKFFVVGLRYKNVPNPTFSIDISLY